MTKNGQYGKFCVFTQLNSTKTIQVAAVALLDTDVCLVFEACLCGVVVGLALLDTDVCLAAGTWLFGKVVGLALLKAAVCLAAKAWLFGEVAGVALLDTDIWLVIETLCGVLVVLIWLDAAVVLLRDSFRIWVQGMYIESAFLLLWREYLKLTMLRWGKSTGRPTEMCCAHLATNTPQSSLFSCFGMLEEGIAKYFQSCMSQFLPIIEAEGIKNAILHLHHYIGSPSISTSSLSCSQQPDTCAYCI